MGPRRCRSRRDRPFFLYWSLIIPHANNERNRALGDGAHVPDYGPYTTEDWPDQDKGQAAIITRIDSYVGLPTAPTASALRRPSSANPRSRRGTSFHEPGMDQPRIPWRSFDRG